MVTSCHVKSFPRRVKSDCVGSDENRNWVDSWPACGQLLENFLPGKLSRIGESEMTEVIIRRGGAGAENRLLFWTTKVVVAVEEENFFLRNGRY